MPSAGEVASPIELAEDIVSELLLQKPVAGEYYAVFGDSNLGYYIVKGRVQKLMKEFRNFP